MPPTITPISGSTVRRADDEAEAERRRDVEQPAGRPDDDAVEDRLGDGDEQVAAPAGRRVVADAPDPRPPRGAELGREALEVPPAVGEQEEHQDARHDVGRGRPDRLRHGVLADLGVELVDEVGDPVRRARPRSSHS